jgi:hypothetical protein
VGDAPAVGNALAAGDASAAVDTPVDAADHALDVAVEDASAAGHAPASTSDIVGHEDVYLDADTNDADVAIDNAEVDTAIEQLTEGTNNELQGSDIVRETVQAQAEECEDAKDTDADVAVDNAKLEAEFESATKNVDWIHVHLVIISGSVALRWTHGLDPESEEAREMLKSQAEEREAEVAARMLAKWKAKHAHASSAEAELVSQLIVTASEQESTYEEAMSDRLPVVSDTLDYDEAKAWGCDRRCTHIL